MLLFQLFGTLGVSFLAASLATTVTVNALARLICICGVKPSKTQYWWLGKLIDAVFAVTFIASASAQFVLLARHGGG